MPGQIESKVEVILVPATEAALIVNDWDSDEVQVVPTVYVKVTDPDKPVGSNNPPEVTEGWPDHVPPVAPVT